MANFPQWMYQLTARDQQVTPLEIVNYVEGQSVTGSSLIQMSYVVPKGKILLLDGLCINVIPGAAQTFNSWQVLILGSGGTCTLAGTHGLALTNQYVEDVTLNSLAIGENSTLRLQATYSASVAANIANWSLFGVLIPRGNFAI